MEGVRGAAYGRIERFGRAARGSIGGLAPPRNRKSALSRVGQGAFSNEKRERKEEKSMSIGVREGIFEKNQLLLVFSTRVTVMLTIFPWRSTFRDTWSPTFLSAR